MDVQGKTPEQIEAERRAATARRIRILSVVAVLVLGARFIIKDPKRRPPPNYTNMQDIKIVPGMLDTLPLEARQKLDPQLVAKMILVDEEARRGKVTEERPTGPYTPAEAPSIVDLEAENYKEQIYAYSRRRQMEIAREEEMQKARDIRKMTLVQFTSGGYVKVQDAERKMDRTLIRLDNTVEATFPNRWVSSVERNALDWEEPVPAGKVRLKPARGITVILHRDTARRITIEKSRFDEI